VLDVTLAGVEMTSTVVVVVGDGSGSGCVGGGGGGVVVVVVVVVVGGWIYSKLYANTKHKFSIDVFSFTVTVGLSIDILI